MPEESAAGQAAFLSTLPASRNDRRFALVVVLVFTVIFVALAPFAKTQLGQVPAFIPIYESGLVITDLITAVLLFGQFRILRSGALLVLASGYVFTAFMTIAHALTFPGLFSPTGLLGAGVQSTAWVYMFWHGGYPLFVVAYVLLRDYEHRGDSGWRRAYVPVFVSVVGVLAAVSGFALLATAGQNLLPTIMRGNRYTPSMIVVVSSVWAMSPLALVVLWRRRPHSVLDLWLMVVLCAWLYDIALAAVLNHGRFDLGFYAGRIYGLLASSFVLIMLLLENTVFYSQLAEAHFRHARRLRILHEIDQAVATAESPEKIASAVIQPLRALLGVPRAIINTFDLKAGQVEWLAAAGRRRTHVGPGVRYSLELMGDVDALKRGEPQIIDTGRLPPGPERDALLASGVELYMAMPMIAGGELIGAISFGGKPGPFPPEQVTIAREVATQLAIAMVQARLYDRVRRQAEELERRVRERTAALQAANEELEAFSYSVSHDLRAPLRAMDGFAAILAADHSERLDADGRRLLQRVRANSQRMGQLIDDLLAFSRLARQPLSKRPVQFAELVNEIVGELRPDYDGRAIEFSVGELGEVEADRALLKQALANLLGNAIKFTRHTDTPVIEIGCDAAAERDGKIYYVKDNGAGFDARYADKLFNVFQRLHRADEYEGTGVGLAIVQRVIRRHGGTVWAEAKPGEGATFFFTLHASSRGSPGATVS